MKQPKLSPAHANHSNSQPQRRPTRQVQLFRGGGKFWQRFLTTAWLLSSILLSPAGANPAAAAVPLPAPALIRPFNNHIVTVDEAPPLGIPEFAWAAVPGATKYHLQISSSIGFETKNVIVDITTPNTTYTPTNYVKFLDTDWYWRVQVSTPAPAGDYSDIWMFTKLWATPGNAPALGSPNDSTTFAFHDAPVFSWGEVTGAAKYRLEIYSSPGGWASTIFYPATTMATSHQPQDKLPDGIYYWRVVPVDVGDHDGTPSVERSFEIDYSPVLTLLEPDPDVLTHPTFTPTFRWTAVRGAQYYRLQYSTDPSFGSYTQVDTRNTTYTPTSTLPNDVNYYWRVRVFSGDSITDWTTASQPFNKRWYIKPVLLTPTNNYQDQLFPLFSWTPVPGAARYFVEISQNPGFAPIYDDGFTSNTFYTPQQTYFGGLTTYYWRVTPYDGSGNKGKVSDTSSYVSYQDSVAPEQVYPLYYYPPDTYTGFPGVTTNPHEDRTVPLPIFIWQRIFVPVFHANQGDVYADAYRLQVSTDPTFKSVDWSVDTENLTAAPTLDHPFTPLSKTTDYYWRVCALIDGSPAGPWSQIWRTRFDLSKGLAPTGGTAPALIRPTNGFEYAEETPLLEWFPQSGATSYDVEISADASFSTPVDTATVPYPAYVPTHSLAQRSLGDVDFGIYYWRVRKTGSVLWSETRRFQISAQSQWKYTRTLGDTANQLQIGSDPASDVANLDYDLTDLQASQSNSAWYFGFHVPSSTVSNVTYALYLDLDHQSPPPTDLPFYDALGYSVTTIPAYQPEYAIYVLQEAGVFTADKVYLYHWNGSGWDTVKIFSSIGGHISRSGNYVELEVLDTAINYQDTNGSYAISLFSLPAGNSGQPQDSVPSDPNVPGSAPISRFANVTERMNLSMPPNNAGVDASTYASILPFFWDWPILAPWSGAYMEVRLDAAFTSPVVSDYTETSTGAYYAWTSYSWDTDFQGDNTYYWRIRPRYRVTSNLVNGAWSQGWSLDRQGFIPQNLQTSVTFATPTFSWDMVEGAESYDLQVDNDSGFGSPTINVSATKQNSYTSTTALPDGIYYWRVRARRNGGVINGWTTPDPECPAPGHLLGCFDLEKPTPTGLTPPSGAIVGHAPTLCWTPLVVNSPATGEPVLAAWEYRLQISKDITFSAPSIYESVSTTEQSCWTPVRGYADGTYYWRVAMLDGSGNLGNYSNYNSFTKQYPITTLLSPLNGVTIPSIPTFVWTPVNGAAKYRLDVSLNLQFSAMIESIVTVNTRYTPTIVYATNKKYYWRVAIVDANNPANTGPFTDATIILDPFPFKVYLPLANKK